MRSDGVALLPSARMMPARRSSRSIVLTGRLTARLLACGGDPWPQTTPDSARVSTGSCQPYAGWKISGGCDAGEVLAIPLKVDDMDTGRIEGIIHVEQKRGSRVAFHDVAAVGDGEPLLEESVDRAARARRHDMLSVGTVAGLQQEAFAALDSLQDFGGNHAQTQPARLQAYGLLQGQDGPVQRRMVRQGRAHGLVTLRADIGCHLGVDWELIALISGHEV